MSITLEQLLEIEEVIASKGWNNKVNKNGDKIIDITYKLVDIANNEQEFVLLKTLISNYFLCTDYDDYCYKIAKNIEATFSGENVVIIPVCDDKMSIKSGHSVAYDLTRFIDESMFTEFLTVESLDILQDRISSFQIVVVDDFIGSGTQFRAFSRAFMSKYKITCDNVYLYSIVIMSRAKKRIHGFCYNSHSCIEFNRSLSDDKELNSIMPAVTVYDGIEKLATVGKNYKRGYLKSEALVTMKKTPNNTLPIFWAKFDNAGEKWPAIFPRK